MVNPLENMKNYWRMRGVRMCDLEETIRRIKEKQNAAEPGTEEFRRLSIDLEQSLKNKKLFKEAKSFGIKPDTVLIILAVLALAGFGFALDLESPKALKIAQFVLKSVPGLRIGS